jgi:hypothetical protein
MARFVTFATRPPLLSVGWFADDRNAANRGVAGKDGLTGARPQVLKPKASGPKSPR